MSERRQQLLEAAQRLFHQYGPHKTTVADIAREAGVGVGTVYLEFSNKDAILLALSESGHAFVLARTRAAWERRAGHERRLRRALEARLAAFLELAEGSRHGADLLHCGECAPVQAAHAAFCQQEHALFETFLRSGADAGDFRVGNPTECTRALLLAYATFSPPALFLRRFKLGLDNDAILRDMQLVHDLVMRGLLPRS